MRMDSGVSFDKCPMTVILFNPSNACVSIFLASFLGIVMVFLSWICIGSYFG